MLYQLYRNRRSGVELSVLLQFSHYRWSRPAWRPPGTFVCTIWPAPALVTFVGLIFCKPNVEGCPFVRHFIHPPAVNKCPICFIHQPTIPGERIFPRCLQSKHPPRVQARTVNGAQQMCAESYTPSRIVPSDFRSDPTPEIAAKPKPEAARGVEPKLNLTPCIRPEFYSNPDTGSDLSRVRPYKPPRPGHHATAPPPPPGTRIRADPTNIKQATRVPGGRRRCGRRRRPVGLWPVAHIQGLLRAASAGSWTPPPFSVEVFVTSLLDLRSHWPKSSGGLRGTKLKGINPKGTKMRHTYSWYSIAQLLQHLTIQAHCRENRLEFIRLQRHASETSLKRPIPHFFETSYPASVTCLDSPKSKHRGRS